MKSDREFIDGIYSKAKAYDTAEKGIEDNQTFLKKMLNWMKNYRMQVSFAAGLAFSAIVLIAGYSQSMGEKIQPELANMPDTAIKNQRGVDIGEPAAYEFSENLDDPNVFKVTTTVYGSIATINKNDAYVDIMVLDSDDGSIIKQTITFFIADQFTDNMEVGEEVIVVLDKNADGATYTLNDYKENLYRFDENSHDDTYTSINGCSIRKDEIKE